MPDDAWLPRIEDGDRPLHERLFAALERDIRSGALSSGARLPPHRALAFDLGLAVGTVTKAYAEAERRGLIVAQVGRGSFVADGEPRGAFGFAPGAADGVIDLARNVPPLGPARDRIAEAIAKIRKRSDLLDVVGYGPPDGPRRHRAAAADWLERRHGLAALDPDEIVITSGAQHALSLAISLLVRPGETLLCEAATFVGVKAIAERYGAKLQGVALDEEGLIPEALDRAAAMGARALYSIPTLQNPTGVVASTARRRAILEIAGRRGLAVIEDDVYSIYADPRLKPPSLRDLDREGARPAGVWFVASASKSVSPGLRVGFLVPPDLQAREAALRAVRAAHYAPPALSSLILTQWIEDGSADAIADELILETRRRSELARRILALPAPTPTQPAGQHLWLPMSELEAERAAGRALRAGVEVTPPSAPIVEPELISGLRVCLGAPPDLATLEHALGVLAAALKPGLEEPPLAAI